MIISKKFQHFSVIECYNQFRKDPSSFWLSWIQFFNLRTISQPFESSVIENLLWIYLSSGAVFFSSCFLCQRLSAVTNIIIWPGISDFYWKKTCQKYIKSSRIFQVGSMDYVHQFSTMRWLNIFDVRCLHFSSAYIFLQIHL